MDTEKDHREIANFDFGFHYQARIELYHGSVPVLTLPRLSGRNQRRIDYRHLI